MKRFSLHRVITLIAIFIASHAAAQPTAFTYQGRLTDGGNAANGVYDLQFTLFNTPTNGSPVSATLTTENIATTNGLFDVLLDFGEGVFYGDARWLEIRVRPGASAASYTTLQPRQFLSSAPSAIFAHMAGAIQSGSIRDPIFLGTTTQAPLDFLVNNTRALRLEPVTEGPNVIGGFSANFVAPFVHGATIAGGGGIFRDDEISFTLSNAVSSRFGTISGGAGNNVYGGEGAIGGGLYNTVRGDDAVVAGGGRNEAAGEGSAVGGGFLNKAGDYASTVAGGDGNVADSPYVSIGGGFHNKALTWFATVGGGEANCISSNTFRSTIAGGYRNIIYPGGDLPFVDLQGGASTIGGGSFNNIFPKALASTIAGGTANNIQSFALDATIGGGASNQIGPDAIFAVISGGHANAIESGSRWSVISGGQDNSIGADVDGAAVGGGAANAIKSRSDYAHIGGGECNIIQSNAHHSTISGGEASVIDTDARLATIGGGGENIIAGAGLASLIAGGLENRLGANTDFGSIGGGAGNCIEENADAATIAGGALNRISREAGTIGGGVANTNYGEFASIGGGTLNLITEGTATIGGGFHNQARDDGTTIAGGSHNEAHTGGDSIGGGSCNYTDGGFGTIAGGYSNQVLGVYATVPGGRLNGALAESTFAAGTHAVARHTGSFVWGDSNESDVSSTASNQFVARASGGVVFYSDTNLTSGVTLAPGSGSWSSLSDRNAKKNLRPINSREVLEKLITLPLATWSYETQDAAVRHLGPMAQDFRVAFGLGEDDKRINTVDADGVALAAIQGLHQKLQEELRAKDTQIKLLQERNDLLQQRVERLEQLLGNWYAQIPSKPHLTQRLPAAD